MVHKSNARVATNLRFAAGVEMVALSDLKLDPKNARIHKPAQIRQIAKSIDAFGFNAPVLVDKNGVVVAGHGRVMALGKLGAIEAPVIRLEHLIGAGARVRDRRQPSDRDLAMGRGAARRAKTLAALDLDFDIGRRPASPWARST